MTYEAVLGDEVLARSDATVFLEGNHYFPPAAVKDDLLQPSSKTTICPWKGRAHYFSAQVGDQPVGDVAWAYPHPTPLAHRIKDHVAFGRPVQVREIR